MRGKLFESLKNYGSSDFYPFHMPGHKGNLKEGGFSDIYPMDITEIDGFDDLHHPETIIKDAQERAAKLYGAEETFFLINGSTSGILSAVSAVAGRADRLIIARNCHRAVYHAAFLNRLKLSYIYPEYIEEYDISGPLLPEHLNSRIQDILLKEGGSGQQASELIAGIVITSPTYDGISSNIKELAEVAHRYGLPLIVDQAHGAHFGLHPAFPQSAVKEGADIVIHSVHKTLPAPTQTALLHRSGRRTDSALLRKYLRIYQSSSPSYLLMAGIDEAVCIASQEGRERLESLVRLRAQLTKEIEKCRYIRICPDTEPGKLLISVKDAPMSGRALYDILRERYHLQMEMAEGSYVLAILTMMDTEEGISRLKKALLEIDGTLSHEEGGFQGKEDKERQGCRLVPDFWPKVRMDLWEAWLMPEEEIALSKAEGRVSSEFICLYPPGIPMLVPGEELDDVFLKKIQNYEKNGYTIQGISNQKIKVVK